MRPLKKQFVGFFITGTLSTVIMYLIYILLNIFMNFQLAYFISYSISVIALYFMNTIFVFKKKPSFRVFLQFPLIYLLQYLVGALSLGHLVKLGVPEIFAPLLVIIIMLPITFVLNKLLLNRAATHK